MITVLNDLKVHDNMPLLPDNMGLLRNNGMLLFEGCPFAAMQPCSH